MTNKIIISNKRCMVDMDLISFQLVCQILSDQGYQNLVDEISEHTSIVNLPDTVIEKP